MEAMNPSDPTLRRSYGTVALTGVAIVVALLGLGHSSEALGALAGSLLGLANLYTLARAVSALLEGRGASWGFVVLVKFIVLLGIAYLLLAHASLSPLGFSVGLGALPLGIVIATLMRAPAEPPGSPKAAIPPFESESDHA